MYLKNGYFADDGPHPADDIGQGYLTETVPADLSELPLEVLEAARNDPEILEEFKPDAALLAAVAAELDAETFAPFLNDEIAFDGSGDCGYLGYGLDIAFSEASGAALVTYTGPSLPSIVRRYLCSSAEAAAALWQEEWAEPLIFAKQFATDNQ